MTSKPSHQVTLGLIQMSCSNNPKANLQKAIGRIEETAKKGAQIVCLSELFQAVYFCQTNDKKFFELAEPIPGDTTQILSDVAKKHQIVLVASVYEKAAPGELYNTAIVFDADGKLLGKYRKLHIPDDLEHHYSELFYFKPGNLGFPVFETRFGKIGVLVCWDQWYPEAARSLAAQGAEIIFYPTAIGWQLAEEGNEIGEKEFDAWVTIQRSHAIANGVFVASCNRIGREDHINFWGGSFIADTFGKVLSQGSHDREEIIMATCQIKEVDEIRSSWPFLKCRRTDAYITGKKS